MSIDGISMNQVKPARELPSNHLSFEAEDIAATSIGDKIEEIDGVSKEKNIGRKEDNYGEDVENALAGGDTSAPDEEKESKEINYAEEIDDGRKRYCLKFNPKSAMVQLYDNKKKKVIRSVDEETLLKIVAKFSHPSGIIHTEKV